MKFKTDALPRLIIALVLSLLVTFVYVSTRFPTPIEASADATITVFAWAADLYHLGIWTARFFCPGFIFAFGLSWFLQKRGKKDET